MFNVPMLFRFFSRILRIAIPFLLMALVLAWATEAARPKGELLEVMLNWEFWLEVVLGTIPVIFVMSITLWLAARYLQALYDLGNWRRGLGFLLRCRCGLSSFGPWMRVAQGQVAEGGDDIIQRIGGPGHLIVFQDTAVVLQRSGQLTKVEGSGYVKLDPLETIYEVIDLRPKRYRYTVDALTLEGIPVTWSVEVQYQIKDDGTVPTPDRPYPFSEDSVLKAATSHWRREPGFQHGQDMDWEGLIVVAQTEKLLRGILAQRPLNELIELPGADEQAIQAAREAIRSELEAALRQVVPEFGAKIIAVTLDNLQVDDEVTDQWIRFWRARWERWSNRLLARGEADYVREYETIKAETQLHMLTGIIQTLERQAARKRMSPQAVEQIVLMRLFSSLDRANVDASARIFLPTQALHALQQLRHTAEDQNQE